MKLHPQLEKDCIGLGRFTLCQLLLMNDANYPWFILVPELYNITELHQLSEKDQKQLWKESRLLSNCLEKLYTPDKLNIAALGNIVPQLHIHHIARYKADSAWPAPVWGHLPATPYSFAEIRDIKHRIRTCLVDKLQYSD
jgi:diadenosine tetraphosphate (Ap4A) HIT family hydrolase